MNFVDREYVAKILPYLLHVRERGNDYNFRCPYCGDSAKSETKTRGWLREMPDGSYMFNCFNCNHNDLSLIGLIRQVCPNLVGQYKSDKFKVHSKTPNKNILKGIATSKPVFRKESKTVENTIKELKFREFSQFKEIRPCVELEWALEYVAGRKIPYEELYNIYAIEDYSIIPTRLGTYPNSKFIPKRAIVFPYYTPDLDLDYLQIRTIEDKFYMTFKVNGGAKIWGRHRVQPDKTIYLFEGAFDGICVKNGVASGGADLLKAFKYLQDEYPQSRKVICFDADFRKNLSVYEQVEKAIKQGLNVTLLDNTVYKDVNDMLKDGISGEKIVEIIEAHTFSGLRAKLEFTKVKKPCKR